MHSHTDQVAWCIPTDFKLIGTGQPVCAEHDHKFVCFQVWYDYGTFCLRIGKQGQAEHCLKEAVAIDPGHKAALSALAALLWHIGLHTGAAYLDQAETVLHAAREVAPDEAAVWAMLSLVYQSMAPRRVSEHRNAAFEMRRLAKVHHRRGVAGNPYLQVTPCCSPIALCCWPVSCVHAHLVHTLLGAN